MPRTCTICSHAERPVIDRALVQGAPLRPLGAQHHISASALQRHKDEHLPVLLAKAQDAAEMAQADDLLAQLRALQADTRRILTKAEGAGKLGTAVMAIREVRGNLELLARLLGELDERPQFNVLIAPEWLTVRAVLLTALAPYPDARIAVAGALAQVEAGANGHARN